MQTATEHQPPSDRNCVLIVSTGKNDLQVIGEEVKNGHLVARPTGHGGRRLHEFFLHHAEAYDGRKPAKESGRNFYEPEKEDSPSAFPPGKFKGRIDFKPFEKDGRYQLFPGKLSRLIEVLEKNRITPRAVLVIYTDRPPLAPDAAGDPAIEDEDERKRLLSVLRGYHADEPVAAGPLLARWLAEALGIPAADIACEEGPRFASGKKACWVNVHKDVTTLEGHDRHAVPPKGLFHYPIALSVARAIDTAVKAMAEHCGGDAEAILSHTGGMADLKECLNASVRFRFGNRIIESHESELQAVEFDFVRDRHRSETPRRADSLLARLHVEQRIWEGDYVGAMAVASHIRPDDVHDTWRHAVQAVHDLFLGLDGEAYARFPAAARIWNLSAMERDIVLAAFRVEAALQHDKGIPLVSEALKALFTFRDLLLSGFLVRVLSENGLEIDVRNGKVLEPKKIPEANKRFFPTRGHDKNSARYLNTIARTMVEHIESIYRTDEARPILDFHNKLLETINVETGDIRLDVLRNTVTHSVLSADEIENGLCAGRKQEIWVPQPNDQNPESLGKAFLEQEIVQNALSVFDLTDLDQCYRTLNGALFDAIRQPIALDNG